MSEKSKNSKQLKFWFWIAFITSWTTFIFFLTIPLGLALWLLVLTTLFIKKTYLKQYLVGLSAWTVIPTINFLAGTRDYFKGQATFKYVGYPSPEFYNLNKEYRAKNSTSGCIFIGYEFLTQTPNNIAIKFWTNLIGVQKGTYTGRYPNETEASQIINEAGKEVNFIKNEMSYNFNFENKNYTITVSEHRNTQNLDSCKTAKVALLDNELIIFKPTIISNEFVTYLADSKTGNAFARYYESQFKNKNNQKTKKLEYGAVYDYK